MAIGKKGPFPELRSTVEGFGASEPSFIGSSQAVGAGHEQYDDREAIDNHNFPNEESGEGQDGTCGQEGSSVMPDKS